LSALFLLLLALAGCGKGGGPELWIIGFDGADWDILEPYMAKGEMPNLARLREGGAWGRMMTDDPMLSPILWTSIATGKTADLHGITWFMSDGPDGSKIPVTSRDRKVRTVWNIASEHDESVGVIGWWATWPAEPVHGFIVSDYVAYHSFGVTGSTLEVPGKTYPPDLMKMVEAVRVPPREVSTSLLLSMVNTTAAGLDRDGGSGPYGGPVQHLRQNISTSLLYTNLATRLLPKERPRLFAIYYEGTDATEHLFGEYAPPKQPWVSEEDYQRYRGTLEAYWKWQDQLLGELLEKRGKNTVVMVISDHGFRTGDERLKENRFDIAVADQSHMPDGIICLNGPGIQPGARIRGADIYDVAPTILHLLGLPVAQDMKGHVLEDAFTSDYRKKHPTATTPTYETGPWDRGDEIVVDKAAGKKLEEMLRSLGYIGGGESDTAASSGKSLPNVEQAVNLAVVYRKQHRYDEAVQELEKVLEHDPTNREARFNLANTYAEMGRLADAETIFAQLVREDPGDPRNWENLALTQARQGHLEDALKTYDKGLDHHAGWAALLAGRGFALHRLGKDQEALASVNHAISLDPRLADAWYYKGAILYDEGRMAEARDALRQALRLNPLHDQARGTLSRVLQAMGHGGEAKRLLGEHADEAGPGVKAQLGSMALQEGRVDEALPLLKEAAPVLNDPEVWGNLGMAYAMSGDIVHGTEAFEKVLRLRPDMQDARAQLAAFYARMGRMDEANRLINEAVAAQPSNARFLVQKGIILAMQGKREESRAAFDKARKLDPKISIPRGF